MNDQRTSEYMELCQKLQLGENCHLILERYPEAKEKYLRFAYLDLRKKRPDLVFVLSYPIFRSRLRLRNYVKFGILNKIDYDFLLELHNGAPR